MNLKEPPLPPSDWLEKQLHIVLEMEKIPGNNDHLSKRITQHIVNNWTMLWRIREGLLNVAKKEG